MLGEAYKTQSFREDTVFLFFSEGKNGVIPKVIVFDQKEGSVWNLGFGDLTETGLDDKVISNNGDLPKVMRTVALTAIQFLESSPDRRLYIMPVDERKQLYNTIMKRKWEELNETLAVFGIINGRYFPYNPKKTFDAFEVRLKSANFEESIK